MKKITVLIALILLLYLNLTWLKSDQVIMFFYLDLLVGFVFFLLLDKFTQNFLSLGLITLFSILCFVFPVFLPALPLLLFGLAQPQKAWPALSLLALPLIQTKLSRPALTLSLALGLLALVTGYNLREWTGVTQKYYRDQDDWRDLYRTLIRDRRNQDEVHFLEQRQAVLAERNRIAREIHDNVGHKLTSAILQLTALGIKHKDASADLTRVASGLANGMEEIRTSVHKLYQSSLDIKTALEDLADNYQFCPVYVSCEISTEPSSQKHYTILMLVREALANTAKHSNADRVDISLRETKQNYQLRIADNGQERPSQPAKLPGIGLMSMDQRVKSQGGQIHISDEQGFRIFVILPLDQASSESKVKQDEDHNH